MFEKNQNEHSFIPSENLSEPVNQPGNTCETSSQTPQQNAEETVSTEFILLNSSETDTPAGEAKSSETDIPVREAVFSETDAPVREAVFSETDAPVKEADFSDTPQSESGAGQVYSHVPPNSFNNHDGSTPPPSYASYQFGQQQPFGSPLTPPNPPKPPKQPRKSGFGTKVAMTACLALVFGLIAGGIMIGLSLIKDHFTEETSTPTTFEDYLQNEEKAESVSVKNYTEIVTDVSQVVDKVMPSVVSITTVATSEYETFWGYSIPQQSQSSGSGVIVGSNDTELLIVTNNHVISGANSLTVTFLDEEIAEAQVKGTDASMDLAVIAVSLSNIKDSTMDAIATAEIGDSTSLKVGEPAIAIGNALGYGQSVTSGIISAVDREVTVDNVTNKLIQTDAAINPGNSGGALLNIDGQLIGINSVKYSSTEVEGMGYAIPISSAMPIIEKLMTRETKEKVDGESGYLGIAGATVTEDASYIYKLPAGVFVSEVMDNSGAEKAGLKSGDVIIEIEGTSINSMEALQSELEYYAPGETITMIVMTQTNSGYTEKELDITLSQRPKE